MLGSSNYSKSEMISGTLRLFKFFRLRKEFDTLLIPMNGYVRRENDLHALYGDNFMGMVAGPIAFNGGMVDGSFDGGKSEEGRSPLVFFRIVGFISGKFFVTNFLRPDPCGMGENELGRIALRRIQDDA